MFGRKSFPKAQVYIFKDVVLFNKLSKTVFGSHHRGFINTIYIYIYIWEAKGKDLFLLLCFRCTETQKWSAADWLIDSSPRHFKLFWYSALWTQFSQHYSSTEVRYQALLMAMWKQELSALQLPLWPPHSPAWSLQPSSRELLSKEDGSPNVPLSLPWRPARYWPISWDYVTYCPIHRTHIS